VIINDFEDVDEVGVGRAVFMINDDPSRRDVAKIFSYFGQGGNFGDGGVSSPLVPKRESDDSRHSKDEKYGEGKFSPAEKRFWEHKFFVFVDEEETNDVANEDNKGNGDVS